MEMAILNLAIRMFWMASVWFFTQETTQTKKVLLS